MLKRKAEEEPKNTPTISTNLSVIDTSVLVLLKKGVVKAVVKYCIIPYIINPIPQAKQHTDLIRCVELLNRLNRSNWYYWGGLTLPLIRIIVRNSKLY